MVAATVRFTAPMDYLARTDVADSLCQLEQQARRLTARRNVDGVCGSFRRSLRLLLETELRATMHVNSDSALLPDILQLHQVPDRTAVPQSCLDIYTSVRVSQWHTAVSELLKRFECDWTKLVEHFGLDPASRLIAISEPLGDLHNHGRAVYKVEFTNGRALIYKPRPVHTEAIFGRLLEWLQDQGCQPDLPHCRALPRSGYGWSDYIPSTPCRTTDETMAFYRRQGGFLAIFWLLCAVDAISDNVVVARDQPIWIDTECICAPDISYAFVGITAMPEWIQDSILTTGMVVYGTGKGVPPRRQSGLDASCTPSRSSVFSTGNVMKTPYREQVLHGFRETYWWIHENRETRCLKAGPLTWWQDQEVRVLLRPTTLYSAIIGLLTCTPPRRRSAVEHDVEVALREREQLVGGAGPWPDEIVRLELAALKRGDVPYWSTTTTSYDVREAGSESVVQSVATGTGMQRIARRATRMCEKDLERQIWLIESFLGRPDVSFDLAAPPSQD